LKVVFWSTRGTAGRKKNRKWKVPLIWLWPFGVRRPDFWMRNLWTGQCNLKLHLGAEMKELLLATGAGNCLRKALESEFF